MWVFTRYGFFSAVCAREGAGSYADPVDPNRIMVRSRVRAHLEALKDRFAELLGLSEIREFPRTDYAFRIFVPKSTWAEVLRRLAEDTDYDNFKSAVGHRQEVLGPAYEESLHKVWSVMYELQQ